MDIHKNARLRAEAMSRCIGGATVFENFASSANASGISKQVEDVVNVTDIVAIELHKRLVDGSCRVKRCSDPQAISLIHRYP
jgi:hypothetical protein